MKIRWKALFIRGSFWLMTEMYLNLVGLDNLADYSEFIFERQQIVVSS
ncbi:MAG: hypothetical protein QNJ70_20450 [Xenococcaceae cyanobacterium MO_207.B15]|nr:hypothetical protein [Xenococcaceae cyanobacterium MO_207.B15]MDJ0743152.1 hypothetical protein [Xenococcaceae cyanobacterium MO_167.B27]